jgi:hypothetical protein
VVRKAALFDVHLLDVLAEIEALLRTGRKAQHEALRARGEPSPVSQAKRAAAAANIVKLTTAMTTEHQALGKVIRVLRRGAKSLQRSLR